jgi:arabinose-5-phosphate isomerase
LSKGDISHLTAQEMMGKNPKTIEADSLAIDAMEMMKKNNITQIIVTHENNYTGVIHLHDLIKEGII